MASQSESPQRGFEGFTLGELQLMLLGLWVLGENEQVDKGLIADWRGLIARLRIAVQAKLVEERDR
jgi:hypothetical protein